MKSLITAAAVIVVGMAATAGTAAAQSLAQAGEASRGQRVFNTQCRACHTLEKDGASTAGPNLHGVFGRKAGTGGGYDSSDAMKKSGIVWDEATLAEYSRDPKGFAAKSARLGTAQAEIDAAETEWMELEMLKEELGS